MDKRLLTILRCPVTHKGLHVANRDTLASVNAAIESMQKDGFLDKLNTKWFFEYNQ